MRARILGDPFWGKISDTLLSIPPVIIPVTDTIEYSKVYYPQMGIMPYFRIAYYYKF